MKKQSFNNWFWDYTYNNWKLTPKNKTALTFAGLIVFSGIVTAATIIKKK
jgi:hypothetical protein